ncbi:MAG: TlpA family protein disulfide reductase [Clostridia bacterium]|nr:TlpA family protein disulfide reductase [Clostridia bacterium]
MNKRLIIILVALIALVLLIFGAVKGYDYLSKDYFEEEQHSDNDDGGDGEADETEVPDSEVPDVEVPDNEVPDNEVPDVEVTDNEVTDSVEETVYIDYANATDDFTVYDENGKEVDLSDFFGKPIVVNFWASWCGPCTSEMPHFEKAYKEYGDEIHFLMVNVGDSFSDAFEFASNNDYTFPIYHDSEYNASIVYGVSSIPMTLFINADGTLNNYQIGMMNASHLEKYISQIK